MSRPFYGWFVLAVAAAAMVGSLPGRTQGLGLITEPLMSDLALDRITYAQLNLWATLVGAVGAVGIGYVIDRIGSRIALTWVLAALGLVVCGMSATTSLAGLVLWITLTRALGQSALSVASLSLVGHWFVRRIDTAMAVYSIAISVGFMAAFPIVGYTVQRMGWRSAWLAVGIAVIALAPVALIVVRRTPESAGLTPDGDSVRLKPASTARRASAPGRVPASTAVEAGFSRPEELPGYSWTETLAMPSFWVFAIGTALYGLVASGIGLFNESILAERGFGPDVYYKTLVVTAFTALAGNFAGGWLAHRVPLGRLMALSLFILAVGLIALPHVSTLSHVMGWAVAMGVGGGLVMVLFFSVWGRVFGRRHLGRIQGSAQALTVVASAVGPLLLAWCLASTGSYAAIFNVLAALVTATGVAALLVSLPAAPTVTYVNAASEGDASA
jgi:MFS family permease